MKDAKIDVVDFLAEDGSIHYGSLLRYWRREVVEWRSTEKLVEIYNEVLGTSHVPVSIRWWQRMEKDNTLPMDLKRRRVIATLLNLPPAYLGLTALAPVFPREDTPTQPTFTKIIPVDLKDYEEKLRKFWNSYYSRGDVTESITTRITALENALLYGEKDQRAKIAPMLCDYLILFGNIRRDQGYSSAFDYLDKAVALAKENNYSELQAKALYVRGYSYFDRWSFLRSRPDLQNALLDFSAANKFVTSNGPLKAAILSEWGSALAHITTDKKDRTAALGTLDQAGHIASASGFKRDPHFLNVNTEWYHIDKSEAFVALGWPKSALQEVSLVYKGDPRKQRRYLSMSIVEAQAYKAKGQIEMAVASAEGALEAAQATQSSRHLVRLVNIYEDMPQEKYNNTPEVARLGVELLKVRQPELFS